MYYWESFYMQVLLQQDLLIEEQKTNEPNPLYSLANITKTTRHLNRYPPRLSTRHSSTLTISTRGESIINPLPANVENMVSSE